jgi:hypothetical protein
MSWQTIRWILSLATWEMDLVGVSGTSAFYPKKATGCQTGSTVEERIFCGGGGRRERLHILGYLGVCKEPSFLRKFLFFHLLVMVMVGSCLWGLRYYFLKETLLLSGGKRDAKLA